MIFKFYFDLNSELSLVSYITKHYLNCAVFKTYIGSKGLPYNVAIERCVEYLNDFIKHNKLPIKVYANPDNILGRDYKEPDYPLFVMEVPDEYFSILELKYSGKEVDLTDFNFTRSHTK